jgi:uncharacterized protein
MANQSTDKKGIYAVITGGTSGIGYEIARCFARDGYDLFIAARSEEGLASASHDLKLEFGIDVRTMSIDLIVPGAAKKLYEEVKSAGIPVGFLVNDAGQGYWGKFTETDLNREIDLVHLNVIAVMSLTKFFLKDMEAQGHGRILQLASSLSKAPSPYMAVYAASKAFVWSFTEALIQEMADTEVTITALLPGATDTGFFTKSEGEGSVEYREKSLYDPAEVAKAGYEGMMDGKDKVVPGAKNKMQAMMGAVLPDKAVAANMKRHMETSDKQEGREGITNERSAEERRRIERETGRPDGDYDDHRGHAHEA